MSNHVIWRYGEEVFLVFDHLAQDWCSQFRTLDEAEACAEELEHESALKTMDCPQISDASTQTSDKSARSTNRHSSYN